MNLLNCLPNFHTSNVLTDFTLTFLNLFGRSVCIQAFLITESISSATFVLHELILYPVDLLFLLELSKWIHSSKFQHIRLIVNLSLYNLLKWTLSLFLLFKWHVALVIKLVLEHVFIPTWQSIAFLLIESQQTPIVRYLWCHLVYQQTVLLLSDLEIMIGGIRFVLQQTVLLSYFETLVWWVGFVLVKFMDELVSSKRHVAKLGCLRLCFAREWNVTLGIMRQVSMHRVRSFHHGRQYLWCVTKDSVWFGFLLLAAWTFYWSKWKRLITSRCSLSYHLIRYWWILRLLTQKLDLVWHKPIVISTFILR